MGVSFLSTVPAFVNNAAMTSSSLVTSTRWTFQPVMIKSSIRGAKEEDSVSGDFALNRRDILKCFGATVGVELVCPNPFVGTASAADLIQRRQRSELQSMIKGTLSNAIKGNKDLIPSILTLALNDALTYDKATKSGGPNGSIRFSSEINRPENQGLAPAMSLVEDAKKEIDGFSKGGPISYADLIQYAG